MQQVHSRPHFTRIPCFLLLTAVLASGSAHAITCPDPLHSLGGEAWRTNAAFQWHSQGQNYEPAQTFRPGANGRHVSDDRVQGLWQAEAVSGTLDWSVTTHYPFSGRWQYRETIGTDSRITGRDGFRPAGPAMSPGRRNTRIINLLQRFPALLFLHGEYHTGSNVCHVTVEHPSGKWQLWLNPATGLPRRSMLVETDPLFGEVENIITYESWTTFDGVQIARRLEQTVENKLIRRERITDFSFAAAPATTSDDTQSGQTGLQRLLGADVPDWAKRRSHWFQRRTAAGAPMDNDPAGEVEFVEITPQLYQIAGGSHHNLVIAGRASLVVVDAPWDDRRSEAVINALAQRWPDKPISYLVLTHHHHDHSGGLMRYVEAGATLVMGVPTRQYFGTVFAKSGRRNIPNKTVSDTYRLNNYGELIDLYHVPNSHAEGMLVVYLRWAKTLYTADLFSPGRDTQHPLWARELLNTIEYLQLDVEKIVGGHGRGAWGMEELREAALPLAEPVPVSVETDSKE